MPELPEVETVKNILQGIVPGKKVKAIDVYYSGCIKASVDEFKSFTIGETFKEVTRRGKFLIFHMSNNKVVVSHLRMEGKYFEGNENDTPDKHDIMRYVFTDGTTLKYNDVRKFGILVPQKEDECQDIPPLSDVGKEPWDLKPEELYKGLQLKKSTIKEGLLDQRLIAGLGNIYDDEVLFATKINPKRKANTITIDECADILKESSRILNEAIVNGGSTIKSYHPKEGVSGLMQNKLLAYGHENESCPNCGFPLRKIFIGGRGTVYCPKCQIDFGKPFIIGVTGPIASGKSTVSTHLESKGYLKIDADLIVSELYQNQSFTSSIAKHFGMRKFTRPELLAIVSQNEGKRKELNDIVHPAVFKEIEKRISENKDKKIVLDIPLLIGSPLEENCDLIITVLANEKLQEQRIAKRGKDPKASLALNKKWPKGLAKKKSGIVLTTDGSLDELYKKLDKYDW